MTAAAPAAAAIGAFAGVFDPSDAAASLQFAGHVVNGDALAAALALPADTPTARLLAAAAARWPDDFAARIDGVFAIAWRQAGGLRLYRDPSGLANAYACPLGGGRVAYASNLTALRALPGVPGLVARRSLHEYLRLLDIAAPNAIVEGVRAVEPGEVLVADAAGLRSLPWPAAPGPTQPAGFEAAVDELDARLRRALQLRLHGAQRPAAFLSGGVDSTLLCALLRELRPDTVALTVGFDGARFDESPAAARVAAHLGLQHRVLRFGMAQCRAALDRYAAGAEQPMADPAILPTLLAFEHAAAQHDVVIDGTGADEAVGAMPPRHVRIAAQYAARLPQPLRRAATRLLRAAGPAAAAYAPIVDFEHPAETVMRWHGFPRAEIEALCGEPVSLAHTRLLRTHDAHPRSAHFARYSALVDAMPCERLNQAVRISGAPLRFPFCDPAVDGWLRQLPVDFRYLPASPKRIARALLARYVPPALWDGPKHGFDFPLQAFLADDDHALVRRHLQSWARPDLIDPVAVAALARRCIAGGEPRQAFRAWALVVLAAWLEHHPLPSGPRASAPASASAATA